ncbi:MAG TPA: CHRD domain-containing protein [Burkholderiales bacterium]|nr:CHRD domain-containing protein [Burkholderiales bacterium]
MNWSRSIPKRAAVVFAAALLAGCAGMGGSDGVSLRLTGAEEVPPVSTSASGSGTVRVSDDGAVSGNFKTQGASFTAAHIHEGAKGANGPVIIPLQKVNDTEWTVPAGAKLTPAQMQSYKQGRLYVNFHSAKFKGGEIRAQIQPGGGGGY